MVIIFFVFTFLYSLIIIYLYFAWREIEINKNCKNPENTPLFFSVIVPVRNEANNILLLLEGLNNQSLPENKFEVLVVDDDSTDGTYEQAEAQIKKYKFSLRVLKLNVEPGFTGSHKKKALAFGIDNSKGNYIVTTDGDCRVQKDWLLSLDNFLSNSYFECVTGPVAFKPGSFFQDIQSIEFAFLIGVGAASLHSGFPNMCNGANLSFSKKAFYSVNGYEGNTHVPSGDDEFLMHKIYHKYPGKVKFLKKLEFTVTTTAKENLKSLFYQRRRWAGKWSMYTDKKISMFAAFYFTFNLIFIASLIMVIFQGYPLKIFLVQWLIRILVDFVFIKSIYKFLRKSLSLPKFLFTEVFYPIYIVTLGIASNFGHYEWKGRKL